MKRALYAPCNPAATVCVTGRKHIKFMAERLNTHEKIKVVCHYNELTNHELEQENP